MNNFLKKIFLLVLGVIVLLSSTSFVIEKKCECCPKVSPESKMKMMQLHLKEEKNCGCVELIIKHQAKRDFLHNVSSRSISKIFFYISSFLLNISEELSNFYLEDKTLYTHFSTLNLKQKIYILNEQFLI